MIFHTCRIVGVSLQLFVLSSSTSLFPTSLNDHKILQPNLFFRGIGARTNGFNSDVTLTTHTSFWLLFPAYLSMFLEQGLLYPISVRATMVTFLAAYHFFTLRMSLFIDLREFSDQRFLMSGPLFVLKPFHKLIISILSANVTPSSLHCPWLTCTLRIRVSSCLFVSLR